MKRAEKQTKSLALGAGCVALSVVACALTSKAEVVDVRYFSPERSRPSRADAPHNYAMHDADTGGQLQVKLGRVTSGPNLRERIAYRDSTYERGYHEQLRWTERPETYVRRELTSILFGAHGLERVLGGAAPTLDVEVIAFDDLYLGSGRAARVQLGVTLFENDSVIFEDTLTVDRQVRGAKPNIEGVIAAMSDALEAVVEATAHRVKSELEQRRAATPTESGR